MLKLLKKRLFSSPAAFADDAGAAPRPSHAADSARRSGAVGRSRRASLRQQLDQAEEEFADEEAYERGDGRRAGGSAAPSAARSSAEERALLDEMRALGGRAPVARPDSKAQELIALARRELLPGGDVERRARHHLHRVPRHAEVAARRPGQPRTDGASA